MPSWEAADQDVEGPQTRPLPPVWPQSSAQTAAESTRAPGPGQVFQVLAWKYPGLWLVTSDYGLDHVHTHTKVPTKSPWPRT